MVLNRDDSTMSFDEFFRFCKSEIRLRSSSDNTSLRGQSSICVAKSAAESKRKWDEREEKQRENLITHLSSAFFVFA